MITFLDENDVEYGALATIKATNAVNGERSLTGTIASGDYVLSNIERGWRLRFDDEYYVVTYAKPIDEGRDVQVEFDAIHQFFWDFDKSSVYDQLADGSHTFVAYLDFVFKNSGYSYTVDTALNVHAFEKQSFGFKKRLTLFNDIITSTGVEFQVNGKVVRILEKVGTDLSTVVRKNFNMNELTIEKNIGDFVTYQKGFGAYFDEEDHSKGRLEVEYTSPLASVYGKLEAEPFVDERYSQSSSLLAALKENVDNSYSISVSLDMEDLTRAGYKYKQPIAGDYIMAINETLGFQEKIRIVSFTSEYDVQGILVKHTVTCNDIGSVKKLSASYTHTQHQAANAEANANTAYEYANKALISADGKNTNYYGDSFPVDNPKGTLKKGDLLFLTVGDTVKQYYWNGADWVINPVLDDVEAFKEHIADELKDVPNREEFENKIAEELATSKAEIETQIETAKTQAESNAKEYADTINEETAKVAELANAAAGEIKADLVNVKNNLTSTSLVANNAQAAVDAAKQELTEVANELSTAKQDLTNSVAEVNTKVDSAKAELTQAKQELETVRNDSLAAAEEAKQGLAEVNTKVDSAKAELTQAKQQLTTVADDLSQAKTDLQTAVSEVDTKATNLQSDLSQAKQDLASQSQQLQAQANAQSELTKRVSSVEKTANGTKTTVSELSKTVAQNGKDITSVTARTKVVEDDLAGTKTTLSQVKTTADSASQKTATLETGLNGLTAKFENLSVGTTNHFLDSAFETTIQKIGIFQNGNVYTPSIDTTEKYDGYNTLKIVGEYSAGVDNPKITYPALAKLKTVQQGKLPDVITISFWGKTDTAGMGLYTRLGYIDYVDSQNVTLTTDWKRYIVHVKTSSAATNEWLFKLSKAGTVWIAKPQFEFSAIASDYHTAEEDVSSKVADYKQTADQNYASLQTTVQNLDGTVQHNKTVADQTAQGFKTRIESLETYKNGESERANAYFESAKTETAKQLTAERTAIANNYVAKSTYTSDVTGIRNELSATTSTANATKTNLANYQASNDKMVASLKSSLQTTDGNVSNLQTKVEAVPGQITSAVSAVEGKIPTSVGGRNYLRGTSDKYQTYTSTDYVLGFPSTDRNWNKLLDPLRGKTVTIRAYIKNDTAFPVRIQVWADIGGVNGNTVAAHSEGWSVGTGKMSADWTSANVAFAQSSSTATGGTIQAKEAKLEIGNIPSDWSPAPEDSIEQISNLSSEIKQTADGMTLLATKTELNSAKNDLQSGINTATNKANSAQSTADSAVTKADAAQSASNSNAQVISTHTTQISALNTGLQAKVSQSDFNTLSGRVTTAENNITAKANELSSKITKVEGKIPTSSGGRNLAQKTSKDWSEPFTKFKGIENTTIGLYRVLTDGLSVGDTLKTRIVLKYTDIIPASGKTAEIRLQGSGNVTNWSSGCYNFSTFKTISGSGELVFEHEFKITADHLKNSYWSLIFRTNWIASGSLQWRLAKVERGMFFTDWTPAPEDTAEQISSLSSELKQTADGITLLATKTELNSAKTELQSGINTATNKANAAQNTANNNAQTISTHTTQISALNTGLQAKVSQTDFNTLSGRVTTAENNITAKANELSSKITSVEGKIPTNIGTVNLIVKSTAQKGVRLAAGAGPLQDSKHELTDWIKVEPNKTYTLTTYEDVNESKMYYSLAWYSTNSADYSGWISRPTGTLSAADLKGGKQYTSPANAKYAKVSYPTKYAKVKFERGNITTDYTPAPEDYDSKLATAQSEIKQTTDAIKASVSSLDNSTVKSSSLTINSDGIVMKAGKSTTDVANAIGSYFAVNQNAINLFSDKINVKGNMIVNGAITSDKIASKSINTAHLNGKIITADVIATNAITTDAIKAGAVTTDKMSANSINGDRIAAGTLDAAKIKAGSITASQIASGTITSNQIKAGGISSANIAAGAITTDKIAAGAIDANKIAANAITANMIRGGQLNSTNGATVFDLNAGTLTFNNNYGYIQRVASDKVFEITTHLSTSSGSQEFLTSAFNIRKSDNSRQAGVKFTLYNTVENKPTAEAKINADALILYDSQSTRLFSMHGKSTFAGGVNFQGWGDIPIAKVHGGLVVNDIGIGSHMKSLLAIVEELCKKAGILWV